MSERIQSPTILVVEADAELRSYLKRCLESLPASKPRVLEAETVQQAIAVLEAGGIDLVIGVLNGRGRGGPALCANLGVGDRGQVPVLLLATGVSSVSEVRGVRSRVATTVLPGTPSASRLCRTVERILTEEGTRLSRSSLRNTPVAKRPVMRREEE